MLNESNIFNYPDYSTKETSSEGNYKISREWNKLSNKVHNTNLAGLVLDYYYSKTSESAAAKACGLPIERAEAKSLSDRCGPVSHDEAREILNRFVSSHFRKTDEEHARFSIPADFRRDDDLRMIAYIDQQREKNP